MLHGGSSGNHFDTTGFTGFTIAYGGAGNDLFDGGDGLDAFLGMAGNDSLNGGGGNDILLGSAGRDVINGAAGNDIIRGQGGSGDILTGGLGDDSIDGGVGNDRVVEAGDVDFTLTNTSLAGAGNDLVRGIEQARLIGGVSNNTIDASAFTGTTALFGLDGDDLLIGGSNIDVVFGQLGNDTIEGGLGDDILFGQDGDDSIRGFAGNDDLYGGLGNDNLFGDDDFDEIFGEGGDDHLEGGRGNDDLRGGLGTDFLHGDDGDDHLFGEDGDDLIRGGLGDDRLNGGLGSNVLDGDDGIDFEEHGFSGDLDVRQFATLTDPLSSMTGLVVYELDSDGDAEVELKAQIFNATPGTYSIVVGGVTVGQVVVDVSGSGFASYSSRPDDFNELPLTSALPAIHDGVTVEVGGASGSFGAVLIDNGGIPDGGPGAGEAELNAVLRGSGVTIGKAEYEVEIEHGRTETEFEVEVYRASPGAVLPVTINGTQVGTLTVNAFGFGKLEYTNAPDDFGELPFPAGFTAPAVGDVVSVGTGLDAVTGTVGGRVVAGGTTTGTGTGTGTPVTSEIELGTRLSGLTGAVGEAEYEVEFEHGRFESQFEVEIYRATPNAALPVTINGVQAGTINTNAFGNGKLEYKDFPDEPGELPFPIDFVAPAAGDIVAVGNVAQGTLLFGFDD